GAPAPAAAESTAPATPALAARAVPASLTAVIGLAAVLGVALSGAPQLVLRFASGALL
ncbi:MAG: NADH-quinone oxidoreductase subunit N, partial [Nonomuraea sp.]|nr:NADH-quinone oxidoreductase subunit N [Nonomuraea sp.]